MVKTQSFSLKSLVAALVALISFSVILPCSAMAETTIDLSQQETAVAPTTNTEAGQVIVDTTCKSKAYDIAVGEIIGGSLLTAVGLSMAIPAIVIEEKANTLWNSTARWSVAATGAVAFVLGAVAVGVASYELHEIQKDDGSSISMTVAPTLGGAMFNMNF